MMSNSKSCKSYITHQGTLEDDLPVPQVRYVSSLEGIYYILFYMHIHISRFCIIAVCKILSESRGLLRTPHDTCLLSSSNMSNL